MITKPIVVCLLAFNAAVALYKAGKYSHGGEDIIKGKGAAIAKVIDAGLGILLAIGLYIDF